MRRVYVLGAGASRFAGFPLGGDLLPFLRSYWKSSHDVKVKDDGEYALDFIDKVKPLLPAEYVLPNGEPDLEFVLSLTEQNRQNDHNGIDHQCLINALGLIASHLDHDAWDFSRIRRGFGTLVTSAFQYKSYQLSKGVSLTSHEDFIRISATWTEYLSPGDMLISFNWDLFQEILLWKVGKWSYEDGYGVQTTVEDPLHPTPITILKLHGSCNWALPQNDRFPLWLDHTGVFFGPETGGSEDGRPLGITSHYGASLIVPSYLKDPLRENVLRSVWKMAASVLREAESLTILGYSLPKADVHAQRLFSEMTQFNETLTSITLVLDNDEESFNRWESLLGKYREICKNMRQTFEEFISPH